MASETEFNKRALQYIGGHLRNVPRLLTGQTPEPVQPWFGSGGQLESMAAQGAPPPQPTVAAPPSTGRQQSNRNDLHRMQNKKSTVDIP